MILINAKRTKTEVLTELRYGLLVILINAKRDSNITNYKINDISYDFDKPNITNKISNIVYRWF